MGEARKGSHAALTKEVIQCLELLTGNLCWKNIKHKNMFVPLLKETSSRQ